MNALRRGLRVLASSATSTEHIVLRPSTFILQSYSTAATRRRWKPLDKSSPPSKDITLSARPSEIPFQPKLANSVDLIGHVHTPVQFQTSPDGIPWAATVLTREDSSDFSHLWIPVIFEGDLAHVAACHLKQNDWIHIAGKISADPSYLKENQDQSNVQVMVQSLHFIQGYPLMKNISAVSKQEQISSTSASEKLDTNPSGKDLHSKQSEKNDIDQSWNDLLSNPNEWWDVRSTEHNLEGAAFERKKNGELLFIDNSTPKWLQEKLQSMIINRKPDLKVSKNSTKNNSGSLLSSWRDLLDDPKQWWDCRDRKHNGLLNPRYPDFKRKDGSLSLWLNKAPKWVLSELEGLDFDVQTVKSKQAKERKGDDFWRDVVENPNKWWDNRSNKSNKRAPDFKHKETGEGLWLDNSPSWVLSKLPPLKPKQEETDRRQTVVS